MKKILSLTLAVLLLICMVPTVHATHTDDSGYLILSDCCNSETEQCSQCGQQTVCMSCNKCEVCDAVPTTNDHSQGTTVTYTGTGTEVYTVTVPAELAPGASGTVTLEGTWASNRQVAVTADANVVLTNSINAQDTKTLVVTFGGITLAGDNNVAVEDTEAVSVAAIEDALFGTWSGKFNYNVEIDDVT